MAPSVPAFRSIGETPLGWFNQHQVGGGPYCGRGSLSSVRVEGNAHGYLPARSFAAALIPLSATHVVPGEARSDRPRSSTPNQPRRCSLPTHTNPTPHG